MYNPPNKDQDTSFYNEAETVHMFRPYPQNPPSGPGRPDNAPPPSSGNDTQLVILILEYVTGWFFIFLGLTSNFSPFYVLSCCIFFGQIVSLLIMDWSGSITLAGLIQWRYLKPSHRFWLGCLLLLLFPLIPGIYLVRYCLYHRYHSITVQTVPSFTAGRAKIALAIGGLTTICLVFALMVISDTISASRVEPARSTRIQTINWRSTQDAQEVFDEAATQTAQSLTPTPVATSTPGTATPTTASDEGTPTPVATSTPSTATPTSVGSVGNPTSVAMSGEMTPTPTTVSIQQALTPEATAPEEPAQSVKPTPKPQRATPVPQSTQPQTTEPTSVDAPPTPAQTRPKATSVPPEPISVSATATSVPPVSRPRSARPTSVPPLTKAASAPSRSIAVSSAPRSASPSEAMLPSPEPTSAPLPVPTPAASSEEGSASPEPTSAPRLVSPSEATLASAKPTSAPPPPTSVSSKPTVVSADSPAVQSVPTAPTKPTMASAMPTPVSSKPASEVPTLAHIQRTGSTE